MELREMIEIAKAKTGSQNELAKTLGIAANVLSMAKASERGLPDYACFKLAAILEIDPINVIAASALATEKNPERRAIFTPFVQRRAASWIGVAVTTAVIGASALPSQSHAKQQLKSHMSYSLHYVKYTNVAYAV